MFGMLPFENNNDNFFDTFDNFQRRFFGEGSSVPAFRTDIRDEGDRFVLECELPLYVYLFLHLDLKDGILTITAQRQEGGEAQKAGNYIRRGAALRLLYPQLRCDRHRRKRRHRRLPGRHSGAEPAQGPPRGAPVQAHCHRLTPREPVSPRWPAPLPYQVFPLLNHL